MWKMDKKDTIYEWLCSVQVNSAHIHHNSRTNGVPYVTCFIFDAICKGYTLDNLHFEVQGQRQQMMTDVQ